MSCLHSMSPVIGAQVGYSLIECICNLHCNEHIQTPWEPIECVHYTAPFITRVFQTYIEADVADMMTSLAGRAVQQRQVPPLLDLNDSAMLARMQQDILLCRQHMVVARLASPDHAG